MTTSDPADRTAAAHRSRARSFDRAAADYAASRPSYPPELLDVVEEFAGRPLRGARVADVGAGTGLATALLHARGAYVVAVEPGPGMARQLRRGLPDVPLVRGDGDQLPFAEGCLDLVTYAQSWHWTDPRRSVPEARRVLRPGGTLALWRNDPDGTVPWIADQQLRLRRLFAPEAPESLSDPVDRVHRLPPELPFVRRRLAWSRCVPLDTHLANLVSHSEFLVRDAGVAAAFLDRERALLARHFPDATVEERYLATLTLTHP